MVYTVGAQSQWLNDKIRECIPLIEDNLFSLFEVNLIKAFFCLLNCIVIRAAYVRHLTKRRIYDTRFTGKAFYSHEDGHSVFPAGTDKKCSLGPEIMESHIFPAVRQSRKHPDLIPPALQQHILHAGVVTQ